MLAPELIATYVWPAGGGDGGSRGGYAALDLTDNEMAKLHLRHLVGGAAAVGGGAAGAGDREALYRCEFPERPGALRRFLTALRSSWSITLFHYRNHGTARRPRLCDASLTVFCSVFGCTAPNHFGLRRLWGGLRTVRSAVESRLDGVPCCGSIRRKSDRRACSERTSAENPKKGNTSSSNTDRKEKLTPDTSGPTHNKRLA